METFYIVIWALMTVVIFTFLTVYLAEKWTSEEYRRLTNENIDPGVAVLVLFYMFIPAGLFLYLGLYIILPTN